MKSKILIPTGYRKVKKCESIREGDLWVIFGSIKWDAVHLDYPRHADRIFIRKIKPRK